VAAINTTAIENPFMRSSFHRHIAIPGFRAHHAA